MCGLMMCWFFPVHEHVPRSARKPNLRAVHLFRDLYLTPKTTGVGESECEVEHIILVVGGFWKGVIRLRLEDNMASGACYRAFTGTF